jgi:fructokinase
MRIAAIEAGGTKFIVGLVEADAAEGSQPRILFRESIPTTMPTETLTASLAAIGRAAALHGRPEAVGIGCFGPVELHEGKPGWGHVTTTPKPGWSGADVAGAFGKAWGVPVAFDTDVNAAACGELLWGAARGLSDFIYLTVGTGIGGGAYSGGKLVHGLVHPEMGHLRLAREAGDGYAGHCPYHADCLEGMAAGPAIGERWGKPAPELPPGHPAWELEARYLARALAAYSCVLSPELFILGGGVGMRPGLAERVGELLGEELAGYVEALAEPGERARRVCRPGLGADAGFLGAAALAQSLFGARDR